MKDVTEEEIGSFILPSAASNEVTKKLKYANFALELNNKVLFSDVGHLKFALEEYEIKVEDLRKEKAALEARLDEEIAES